MKAKEEFNRAKLFTDNFTYGSEEFEWTQWRIAWNAAIIAAANEATGAELAKEKHNVLKLLVKE